MKKLLLLLVLIPTIAIAETADFTPIGEDQSAVQRANYSCITLRPGNYLMKKRRILAWMNGYKVKVKTTCKARRPIFIRFHRYETVCVGRYFNLTNNYGSKIATCRVRKIKDKR